LIRKNKNDEKLKKLDRILTFSYFSVLSFLF
jgi:hypothetical protein